MTDHTEFEPAEIQAGLKAGRYRLIDVREPGEHASERIPEALLVPLSRFRPGEIPEGEGCAVVLHCRSGVRSARALDMCRSQGIELAGHMRGGILKWKAAGLPTERADRGASGLTVPQAVAASATVLVVISVGLAASVSPWWLILAAGVAVLLFQARLTGFCPFSRFFAGLGLRSR
ncbi:MULTISPECIES: rhodanese family protein [Maricaulis]|jgi:rhodanese-related sulfurtransferase|uniref:Rhodanese domain protein n=1 Tax=Maricaulis maris (strain MCS10) TaxID=394221 RepID=Q0AP77_MARMM|nr:MULTISPECIES: rhodanese family protein [Maricaulis]ABI65910.1 Rhodanese domain protein [Maricaulis maris MCS10]MAC89178.1 hypothetical protein [Maricaulis sp.]